MRKSDIKRPQSVKAEFDPNFDATDLGGAILVEKVLRSLGLRRMIDDNLPQRAQTCGFSTTESVYSMVAAMLCGGKGMQATELLRDDCLVEEIFGLRRGAPSAPTLYRVLCELSGLEQREQIEHYEPCGPTLPALDMFGHERRTPNTRRIVPEEPERMEQPQAQAFDDLLACSAKRAVNALPHSLVRTHGWNVCFGDATDLQVEGRCFDAARVDRHGDKILRWQTLMLGPVVVAQEIGEGNRDEGVTMPDLFKRARGVIADIVGAKAKKLGLLDAAYFEREVIEPLAEAPDWDFIVSANQQRGALTRIAKEQPEVIWRDTGVDARRGWSDSQVGCFSHMVEGGVEVMTIVARRWREEDDLPGIWRYSFLATQIEPSDLPQRLRKEHGYCSAIWMLYGTKQARENHYKTPLCNLGMHNPPSGRLGLNQAFYAIGSVASNIAMVLRYRVMSLTERGIELWRMRQKYFQIAGRLVRGGRTLVVHLAGANVEALRQALWQEAFAEAARL